MFHKNPPRSLIMRLLNPFSNPTTCLFMIQFMQQSLISICITKVDSCLPTMSPSFRKTFLFSSLFSLSLVWFVQWYTCLVKSINYLLTHTHQQMHILFKKSKIYIRTFITLLHVSITRSSSGRVHCSLLKL